MARVYHWICMPEVELLLSNESVDHLTEDLEAIGVRVIMLTRAARWHHGYVETELLEWIEKLKKSKEGLVGANKELKALVKSLEAMIIMNKNMVDEAHGVMNHNIELRVEVREK